MCDDDDLTAKRPESDEEDDDEDHYEEGAEYDYSLAGYTNGGGIRPFMGVPPGYGPFGGGSPTVLRVPAHRPVVYPLLGSAHPWLHGSPFDRPTALAPHYPTLDKLAGIYTNLLQNRLIM